MKYNLVFVSIFTKTKRRIFVPAIKLEEYGEKTLVATFKTNTKKIGYNNYYISRKDHAELELLLRFSGNIFLAKNNRVKESYLNISLSEEEIEKFIKTLGLLDLKTMNDEDFEAFITFASHYYKNLVKEGAVLPILKERNTSLQTFYVEEKMEDGMICVPLSYEPEIGLKLKSFERVFVPYKVYITDIFYCELQKRRINEMLENNSLKLKWVFFLIL